MDRFGGLHPFTIGNGTAPPPPSDVFYDTSRTVRGVALLSDGRGGFTVEGTGELHPFTIDELPPGAADAPSWPGWEIARDVAVLPE